MDGPAGGIGDRDPQTAGGGLLGAEDLSIVPYRSVWHAGRPQDNLPIRAAARFHQLFEQRQKEPAILHTQRIGGKARILAQIGPPGSLAEALPLSIVADGEDEPVRSRA